MKKLTEINYELILLTLVYKGKGGIEHSQSLGMRKTTRSRTKQTLQFGIYRNL